MSQMHETSTICDTGSISMCDPNPDMSNAFPFSLIPLDSYQKGTHWEMEKSITERKPTKKSKGGDVEMKKLGKTLFSL